jgi:translation elongation factor P/translation initiation factor 5A
MAGKIKKGNFIDLGDEPMEMPSISTKGKSPKYYPSIRMKKKGIKKAVGKTGTALVKFKVRSVELRDGQAPETCLDITGIQEQD